MATQPCCQRRESAPRQAAPLVLMDSSAIEKHTMQIIQHHWVGRALLTPRVGVGLLNAA